MEIKRKRTLKPDAVPTLFTHKTPIQKRKSSINRAEASAKKKVTNA